ncbi:MAG: soxA [Noviherbaspirillum sp.]|nr:soxA [Noviherbaspirillum sp.]
MTLGRLARFVFLALIVGAGVPGSVTSAEADWRRPGSDFMGASTQAMQRDDMLNPAMLWTMDGEALWHRPAGKSEKSCASCHGDAKASMRGVAARYPAFDIPQNLPLNLGGRINQCRVRNQQAAPFRAETKELLSLESHVALQSRGMPTAPPDDDRMKAVQQRGMQLFTQRMGQLNLSCAQCHDDNWGKRLGGSVIPQAHPGGYPIYRLEWQAVGSLQRRLRNCMTGVRADPYAYDAQEMVELEAYLAARAKGMPLEAPGVRP